MSKIFEQLLQLRGLNEEFLHPQYGHTADPYVLPGMREAVDRIKRAVQDKEKILIYGDYDVDGVTASTVMEDTLKLAFMVLPPLARSWKPSTIRAITSPVKSQLSP